MELLFPVFHALVPAAGLGVRFGATRPKQLVELAGRPLLAWTLERLAAAGAASLTVALPADYLAAAADCEPPSVAVRWVTGGASRQASVAACLAACGAGDDELVAVHDGARPLVAAADIRATVVAAAECGAAVLGRPVSDTLKRFDGRRLLGTVDRSELFRAETPQVFRAIVLRSALAAAADERFEGTDEAAAVERFTDVEIQAVTASTPNPKLTLATDLLLLAALLDAETRGAAAGSMKSLEGEA